VDEINSEIVNNHWADNIINVISYLYKKFKNKTFRKILE